jgi:hypothetical protein
VSARKCRPPSDLLALPSPAHNCRLPAHRSARCSATTRRPGCQPSTPGPKWWRRT